jgi:hypothetical protein
MAQVRYCVKLTIPLRFRKFKCKRYLLLSSKCLLRRSCTSWTDWGRLRGMLCRVGSNSSGIRTIQPQAMVTLTITTVIIFPSITHNRLVVGVRHRMCPCLRCFSTGSEYSYRLISYSLQSGLLNNLVCSVSSQQFLK